MCSTCQGKRFHCSFKERVPWRISAQNVVKLPVQEPSLLRLPVRPGRSSRHHALGLLPPRQEVFHVDEDLASLARRTAASTLGSPAPLNQRKGGQLCVPSSGNTLEGPVALGGSLAGGPSVQELLSTGFLLPLLATEKPNVTDLVPGPAIQALWRMGTRSSLASLCLLFRVVFFSGECQGRTAAQAAPSLPSLRLSLPSLLVALPPCASAATDGSLHPEEGEAMHASAGAACDALCKIIEMQREGTQGAASKAWGDHCGIGVLRFCPHLCCCSFSRKLCQCTAVF